ncbi:MAG: hypothetical protein MRECE_42c003 [Mycoplasmataceae bacterium CE_OT135]|nr:MAG: hypothetical protein MRECE_42c003 [Mycoplasmataceae bacterium CE_OT135]
MKDKAYWRAYNQKRQAYLKQKKQESRQRLKGQSTTDQTGKVVDPNQVSLVVDIPKVVDSKAKLVVDETVVDIGKQVVDQKAVIDNSSSQVVDRKRVADTNSQPVVDQLTQLIHQYQTATNYNCASGCSQDKYCSNCWYFEGNNFLAYKEVAT